MSLYLPVHTKGTAAIAICNRCRRKMYYVDLRKDPNNQSYYCAECVDQFDPWRLPAIRPEGISLEHPYSDEELV